MTRYQKNLTEFAGIITLVVLLFSLAIVLAYNQNTADDVIIRTIIMEDGSERTAYGHITLWRTGKCRYTDDKGIEHIILSGVKEVILVK